MKRRILPLLAALLLLSAALAEGPSIPAAASAMDAFRKAGVECTFPGTDPEGRELLSVILPEPALSGRPLLFLFAPDSEEAALYVLDLATVKPGNEAAAMDLCNRLNTEYRFFRFCYTPEDRAVLMDCDLAFRGAAGEICAEIALMAGETLLETLPLLAALAE